MIRAVTVRLAVRNLLLHKLRSFLTMLGTILGVGSVIAMLAIGEGSKREAVEQIRQLGATNVIIRSIKPSDADDGSSLTSSSPQQSSRVLQYGLQHQDFERLTSVLPMIEKAVPISLVRRNAQHERHRIRNARILGTTPDYLGVKNLEIRRGRFVVSSDLRTMSNIVVLGAGAAKRLFVFADPIGEYVLLGNTAFRVVGVLNTQATGSATPGAIGKDDFNNDLYIPLSAARARFGELQMIIRSGSTQFERTQLNEITLTVETEDAVSEIAALARKVLRKTHPAGDDFEIQVPLELLLQAEREKRIWNIVLGSIGGISLLVGGVGIMNIMLATVTERTREIGIRRALGAKQRDITIQFLVETIVLSSTGGLLGIVVGVGIPISVTIALEIQTALSWWSILLAFSISVAIGIVFGLYPARRAALMDPIEALRHE